jgi:hypothetical protein
VSEGVRDGRPRVVPGRGRRGRGVGALLVVALLLALLAACQLVLPGLAAGRLRAMLARSGSVRTVSVSAWPAVELLWHHADNVTVSMRRWSASSARLDAQLRQLRSVGTFDATVGVVDVGALVVHDASLVVSRGRIVGEGTVREADLRRAVPFLRSVVPVASAGGRLVLRGTASVLGLIGGSVDATVQARRGALVLTPDVPLGGLGAVTVFSAPGVRVSGVSARTVGGGFVARVAGRLR